MSRLYYDKPTTVVALTGSTSNDDKAKEYLEKVSRLIPVEIVAAYMTLIGLIPAIHDAKLENIAFPVVFALCLILTPVYLSFMSDKGKPKRIHLVVSTFAFLFWAYSVSGHLIPQYYNPAIASILLIIFTLVSGLIPLN